MHVHFYSREEPGNARRVMRPPLSESDAASSLDDATELLSRSELKRAHVAVPHRAPFLSSAGSTDSEEELELSYQPRRVQLERVNPPKSPPARGSALASSLTRPGRAVEAVSTSSSTLVEPTEHMEDLKASGTHLSRALAATKLRSSLSPPREESGRVQPLSSTPRRARLSLSPPVLNGISPPSSGLAAREAAQNKIRRIFDSVRNLEDADDSPIPSKVTTDRAPITPSTTARDRARLQRGLGLSTGDRAKPAMVGEYISPVAGPSRRQRDVTRSRALLLHESDLEDDEGSDDAPPLPIKTPHPPGHLTFRQDSPSHTSPPPALSRARFVRPMAEHANESESETAQFVVPTTPPRLPRSMPSTPLPTGKGKGKARAYSSSSMSPRKAVFKGVELFARLREALKEEEAAFKQHAQEQRRVVETSPRGKALRERERELRTSLARSHAAYPDVTDSDDASESVNTHVKNVEPTSRWPTLLLINGLIFGLSLLCIRALSDASYRQAYFDGMVPPSIYAPLGLINDYATRATMQAFGTDQQQSSLRALWLAANQSFTTRLLRIIEMPPNGFRIPT